MSVTEAIGSPTTHPQSFSAARKMAGMQRRQLALEALAGVRSVTQLAHDNEVSRKFVRQQAAKGAAALDQSFAQSSGEQEVLFTLPVTRQWLRAFMVELILNGHSPMRGDVACLTRWLAQDVLAIAGPDLATRRELCDWIVAELRLREAHAPHRLGPLCRLLEHNRDDILGFVTVVEQALAALAQEFHVALTTVQALCQWQGLPADDPRRWQQEAELRRQLGARFYPLQHAVQHALAQVVRASSIIENLNSRLRSYFFLRRELGPEYLDLLRFFLNHRRFQRSQRAERVGRSPIELLTGQTQPHWLALLGYPLPAQAA